MRADTQRKPLIFQWVTAPHYRCVVFCVVDLMESEGQKTKSKKINWGLTTTDALIKNEYEFCQDFYTRLVHPPQR